MQWLNAEDGQENRFRYPYNLLRSKLSPGLPTTSLTSFKNFLSTKHRQDFLICEFFYSVHCLSPNIFRSCTSKTRQTTSKDTPSQLFSLSAFAISSCLSPFLWQLPILNIVQYLLKGSIFFIFFLSSEKIEIPR